MYPVVNLSSGLVARHASEQLSAALKDTRVVLVNGARQAGKSTIVRLEADRIGAEWRTLDDPAVLEAARSDPVGFLDAPVPLVIDEVQRAPELFLPLKARVDRDGRPGRFLLTGSASVRALRGIPDALPGRIETIELWPFSQGEIDQTPDRFIDAAFELGPDLHVVSEDISRQEYLDRLVRGGFPEAVARANPRRRGRFLEGYITDIISRDVQQLSDIERQDDLRRLLRSIAARSGSVLALGNLASGLGLPRTTAARYLELLELVFLVRRVPAWSRKLSTRSTAAPKIAMVDSGLGARLLGVDAEALRRPGATPMGGLLEGFVLMELARQLTWSETLADLYHYRTRDQVEVDAVLERRDGRVVGIEVKASSTVRTDDFRGLRHLEQRLGDEFVVGVLLYTGTATLPFGPRLRAVPVSALWRAVP